MSRPVLISGLILIAVAVSLLGYGGYMAYRRFTTALPLRVTSVAFTSNPTAIRVTTCGAPANFEFQGTVTTNGQVGRISWVWTQNSVPIPTQNGILSGTKEATQGQPHVKIKQTFSAFHQSNITVPVVLDVTSPGNHESAPVLITYACH
jgi:hypothetical protein